MYNEEPNISTRLYYNVIVLPLFACHQKQPGNHGTFDLLSAVVYIRLAVVPPADTMVKVPRSCFLSPSTTNVTPESYI